MNNVKSADGLLREWLIDVVEMELNTLRDSRRWGNELVGDIEAIDLCLGGCVLGNIDRLNADKLLKV